MKQYIYHFCIQQQGAVGSLTYFSGLATMDVPVIDKDSYNALKKQVFQVSELHENVPYVVLTLSCLHEIST